MLKRVIPFAMAVTALLLMAGCGGVDAVLVSDLTTFDVAGIDYYDEYTAVYGGSLVAGESWRIMVVTMTAQSEFDETRYKSYFCSEDGTSMARIYVDETDMYECMAVGYQEGSSEDVMLYVLAFQVPSTVQKAKTITLEAPGHTPVVLKGKLPDGAAPMSMPQNSASPAPSSDMPDDTVTDEPSVTDEISPTDGLPEDASPEATNEQ